MKFKRMIKESYEHPNAEKAIGTYRRLAGLEEGVAVDPERIDEYALNEAAIEHRVPKADLRHMILGEEITVGDLDRQMEAEKELVRTKTEIEELLDDTYRTARKMHKTRRRTNFPTILIEGEAGIGKTSIVKQWCKENGLNFFSYDIRQASPESFEGVVATDPKDLQFVTRKISRELLIPLSRPNCVFFIDEYNRVNGGMRNKFMDLILNHRMQVPFIDDDFEASKEFYAKYGELEEDGSLFFPNLLFVVCAQNPYNERYSGTYELDAADVDRMKIAHPNTENEAVLQYMTREIKKDIAELDPADEEDKEFIKEFKGQLAIATKLLRDPKFYFDTTEERDKIYRKYGSVGKNLTPRSFEFVIRDSKGTKDSVLKMWDYYCNKDKKETVEAILSDYVDVEDEATAALKVGTDSSVLSNNVPASVRILQKLGM